MISAKGARGLTQCTIGTEINNTLMMIEKKITSAAHDGKYLCAVSGDFSKKITDKLEELGYKVTRGSQYNESYIMISW